MGEEETLRKKCKKNCMQKEGKKVIWCRKEVVKQFLLRRKYSPGNCKWIPFRRHFPLLFALSNIKLYENRCYPQTSLAPVVDSAYLQNGLGLDQHKSRGRHNSTPVLCQPAVMTLRSANGPLQEFLSTENYKLEIFHLSEIRCCSTSRDRENGVCLFFCLLDLRLFPFLLLILLFLYIFFFFIIFLIFSLKTSCLF